MNESVASPSYLRRPTAAARANAEPGVMCDKCQELDNKIDRYRRVIRAINDQHAIDGITEAEKVKLHPEKA